MTGFVHRAFFYRDEAEWVDGLAPFIREGVAADEPVLAAVPMGRIELLREAVGADAWGVDFVAMELIGKNPGRIISAWHDFIDSHPGRRLRGIGEPVWPGRRADEVVECQHHEHLLNVAFDGHEFELVCPYDMSALPDDVVDQASRSHPFAGDVTTDQPNPSFSLVIDHPAALPAPPAHVRTAPFDRGSLRMVRQLVEAEAAGLMCDRRRIDDLVLAVSEAATNSIQYGGGGVLSLWSEPDRMICEIADGGHLSDPLVGRRRPATTALSGRGVWMVQQMCDLVQIRTADDGTRVRLAMEFNAG